MKYPKKGITYKVRYKLLKNQVTEKLDKNHQFQTKKARREAIRGVTKESRQAFERSVEEHLAKCIDAGIESYNLSMQTAEVPVAPEVRPEEGNPA